MPRLANPLDGRRRAINTKIKEDVRSRLEAASRENDRTLSLEIEDRLDKSFDEEKRLLAIFGSAARVAIVQTIADLLVRIEETTGKTVDKDLATGSAALVGIVEIAEFYAKIAGSVDEEIEEEAVRIGRAAAIAAVKATNPTLRRELFPDGVASPHDTWLRAEGERHDLAEGRKNISRASGRKRGAS